MALEDTLSNGDDADDDNINADSNSFTFTSLPSDSPSRTSSSSSSFFSFVTEFTKLKILSNSCKWKTIFLYTSEWRRASLLLVWYKNENSVNKDDNSFADDDGCGSEAAK